eukprot:GHRR01034696.1.p1 GENE.GHRR01034696.1~~GHRR01034696.1.p1  ORF type:complete len:151 (-),score=11.94 GHRR01034696.1:143-595(-)
MRSSTSMPSSLPLINICNSASLNMRTQRGLIRSKNPRKNAPAARSIWRLSRKSASLWMYSMTLSARTGMSRPPGLSSTSCWRGTLLLMMPGPDAGVGSTTVAVKFSESSAKSPASCKNTDCKVQLGMSVASVGTPEYFWFAATANFAHYV